jgi:hypothetical protein
MHHPKRQHAKRLTPFSHARASSVMMSSSHLHSPERLSRQRLSCRPAASTSGNPSEISQLSISSSFKSLTVLIQAPSRISNPAAVRADSRAL